MTEAEWMACANPELLVRFLGIAGSARKLRLFAVACCYQIEPVFPDSECRTVIECVERYCEGSESEEARLRACQTMKALVNNPRRLDTPLGRLFSLVRNAVYKATKEAPGESAWGAWSYTNQVTDLSKLGKPRYTELLRDIFGNPFRPVTLDPPWLTSTVVSLAQAIYQEKAFDHLPILADALEDAGCNNEALLNHCRQGGEHVRGCWCLDLILGKE